jgi:hypothetical protein
MRRMIFPLVLLVGCGAPAERADQKAKADSAPRAALRAAPAADTCLPVQPPSEEQWDDREARVIARLGDRARRMENGLLLKLDSGGDVVLRDIEGDEDLARYRLAGWNERLHAYEVAVAYYEGGTNLLVDARTGRQTKIWGMPVVSPDGRRFVALSMDLEAAYDPNGIQVWRSGGDSLEVEWQAELAWGPSDPRWLNDSTFSVRAHPAPGDMRLEVLCVVMSRAPDGWRSREAGT